MKNELPEVGNKSENKNLCKRGCGFYGSVQFKDMCSKCYQEQIKSEHDLPQSPLVRPSSGEASTCSVPAAHGLLSQHLDSRLSSKAAVFSSLTHSGDTPAPSSRQAPKRKAESTEATDEHTKFRPALVNRCARCRKRVGLTGFSCRCNGLYCSAHRYSDQHECTFDYQALGRAELARDNPAVRCAKIRKL